MSISSSPAPRPRFPFPHPPPILTWLLSAAAVLALMIPGGCSGLEPEIEEFQRQVLLRDDGANRYEELTVFVRVSDPDDEQDPAVMVITAGDTGLKWSFHRDQWIPVYVEDRAWWGLPGMIPYSGSRLPDVLYTLTLSDLAGHETRITFRLPPERPTVDEAQWPRANVSGTKLRFSGGDESSRLIFRAANGDFLNVIPAFDDMEFTPRDAASWEIWSGPRAGADGFRLGPYSLSPPAE